ncbi:MAG: YihY/virulence factor BrkB family protein [Oligoflexia bacterium]|nr:YihY/virulence factor BrkB family protein [Oligoflexia bacterium]
MRKSKRFFRELRDEIKKDNLQSAAAALAYYLMLAIFPAMIFLLSLLPYLPIPNLQESVMGYLNQLLPGDASKMFSGTVQEVLTQKRSGLLSLGAIATLWAASNGTLAVMRQLNITSGVKETRSFVRARATAVGLTLAFGALVISAFGLIMVGDWLGGRISEALNLGPALSLVFAVVRWGIVLGALALSFSLIYRFAPDFRRKFRLLTPGSVTGVLLWIAASLAFKLYVDQFGKYNATYGGIGAVIVLMLWLNITGMVLLLGSEIDSVLERGRLGSRETSSEKSPDHRRAA